MQVKARVSNNISKSIITSYWYFLITYNLRTRKIDNPVLPCFKQVFYFKLRTYSPFSKQRYSSCIDYVSDDLIP